MEKTITLETRIKKYSALAMGVASATAASAQVVYTDVNPDMVLSIGGTTSGIVDFNNDATADMAFGVAGSAGVTGTYAGIPYTGTQYLGAVQGSSSKSWMASSSSSNLTPMALAAGATIDGAASFSSSQGYLAQVGEVYFGAPYNQTFPINGGNFTGTEAFLGARFDVAGATHYGWVRVEASADGKTLTIKDYAYDATAGTGINAGDVGSGPFAGVNDISSEVVIRTIDNTLRVELENASKADISVTNLAGQKVVNEQMNNSYSVIGLSDLTTGIYLVNVSTEAGTTTKKIYVN